MLTLHIANKNLSSWSLRPWLLLKILGVPFHEVVETFSSYGGNGHSYEKFRRFSPTGLVPCLKDGELLIWDSLAICEHIAEAYPAAWPQNKSARVWARSATAEMHSGFQALRTQCPMNCSPQAPLAVIDAELSKDLARIVELWENGLQSFAGPFLAGNRFTTVDAFFAPVAIRIHHYQLPVSTPCQAWIARILALPALQKWIDAARREIEPAR
ncbi:glutathione S-transferase family protein [Paenalcaligenes sp. Me131]|uniref:glutathione S-transferase family protein n=1 Tax=Paenalcaligenes sp. Me131 TaxID=3392636 RepID=UPI003D28E0F2